ncbi:excinuclease ABC subunit UvrA [Yimella sp. cx-51]|uniref:excinuclease ABC subunit UvrA n=1 Tax=Yimella sp. cx-51 TaxID=2770551 RepID=UPI00165E1C7C|nr:excinuclease ABC subunit UvrA [Yimella sp. cx-51]MBC9955456.1 excinuclease ABC subunit UvrA [Yimella sp. cx-51]QTH37954.1 excinuclease ABC subunit UvrA [Yimella sp. cx-51]
MVTTENTELSGVQVRGARQNNLRNADLDLPRDAIVAFTGVSGSGKSSLAFGTLYAESQRRYLESVAPYARRLIDQAGVPDVDSIEGLPPAVALQQQRGGGNARSTVASVTTLSSLVRMLYSRAGCYPPDQPMLYAEDFSSNTVQGACPTCHGIGRIYEVTEEQMVPDPSLTIRERAIASWPPAWQGQNQRDILVSMGYDVDIPWRDLPRKQRDWILFTEERPTVPVYAGLTPSQTRKAIKREEEPSYQGTFVGARRYVLDTFASTKSAIVKRRVSQFVTGALCPMCDGKQLKLESLSVTFEGMDIAEFAALPLARVAEVARGVMRPDWVPVENMSSATLDDAARRRARQDRVDKGGSAHDGAPDVRRTGNLSVEKQAAARRLCEELLDRLEPMIDLGLGYLSLDRTTPTLSGGELQRLRLATALSSKLFGVVYVLDEPSAGLHPRDLDALLGILHGLKRRGNSVFVVEHSLPVVRAADWLVDIGPGAGENGGEVLYSGEPSGLGEIEQSVTRRYLFAPPAPVERQPRDPQGWLRFTDISRNNLHDVDVEFPLGCLTAVTGISGSGKSSLVSQAVPALVESALGRSVSVVADDSDENDDLLLTGDQGSVHGHVDGGKAGLGGLRRVVAIDQKPIGRTPRSNVATYTGLFDHVRKLYAATPEARKRQYKAGRFSFNVAAGRCDTCEGEGAVMVELLFLPSIYSPCPTCHGTRYKDSTLEITWHDRNIAQVLALSVDEVHEFFAEEAEIERSLRVLRDVGLGYLRLGQPAPELSGGEAQRVKLASELQRAQRGDTRYVLDEPAAGLHSADSDRLLAHLQGLVDSGNTVVMVELNMRMVAQADHVIDLGPGAGADGGQIVATGTPSEVSAVSGSFTAPYLKQAFAG